MFILCPGHSTGTNPVMLLGCSSSSQPNTDNTSPCLGALTSPSFRHVQDQILWKIFYISLSTLAPAKTKSSFLVNRIAVLYSSPITGSSGPCAMTHFLQQADDEMSREKLFSCLVYACKKTLQATQNLPTPKCSTHSLVPAWCYQQCPLITLPSDSLASKAKPPALSQ